MEKEFDVAIVEEDESEQSRYQFDKAVQTDLSFFLNQDNNQDLKNLFCNSIPSLKTIQGNSTLANSSTISNPISKKPQKPERIKIETIPSVIEALVELVQKKPLSKQEQLRIQLKKKGIVISRSKISRILELQNFVYRRCDYFNFTRNTPEIIQKRVYYCQLIKNISNQSLYFSGEFQFELQNLPKFCWVKRGLEDTFKIRTHSQDSVTVIAIINMHGLLGYTLVSGNFNMSDHLTSLIEDSIPNLPSQQVFIMEKPEKQYQYNTIQNMFEQKHIRSIYLPPHSFILNPIQNFFSVVKSKVKKQRSDSQENITLEQLIAFVKQSMESMYQVSLNQYYRSMRDNLQLGLKKIPFAKTI